jgi:hypothetical protein
MMRGALVLLLVSALPQSKAPSPSPAELTGTWRGTSTCTDRVVVPSCTDETAAYEFTPGSKPGTVHWFADKVVNGERVRMGESDLTYDTAEACWKAELKGPRLTSVWCLSVDGVHLTGTARLLPGNQTFRKLDLRRQ